MAYPSAQYSVVGQMVSYSHSRLGTFQQCRYRYKLKYIDKVKAEIPATVETFMGSLVHTALEKLYKDLQFQKLNTKEDLLDFFDQQWDATWDDNILIAKAEYTSHNYRDMGKKFIADFYDHYKPFNHLRTLGLETEDRLDLGNGHQYHIRIDRLATDGNGTYYVCDYKTNSKLKAQGELDEDRQLAMYSLWVKQQFGDCQVVKLVWYFLAFDKEMVSERSEEQLSKLKQEVVDLIGEIECCTEYPTNVTALCDYCEYRGMCPAFKHKAELEAKTPEEYSEDDGLLLVDEYAKWDSLEKEAKKRKEELQEELISFAGQHEVEAIYGSEKRVAIRPYTKWSYPSDESFVSLLKEHKIYDDLSMLCFSKIASLAEKGKLPTAVQEKMQKEEAQRLTLAKIK